MIENRAYGASALILMGAAYLSWNKTKETPSDSSVVLIDESPRSMKSIRFTSSTSTVVISFLEDKYGPYTWFEFETRDITRSFVANESFDQTLESYTKFEALRSLGRLAGPTLNLTKLGTSQQKLEFKTRQGGYTRFDVGGRTSGARDVYVRKHNHDEVFLVRGELMNQLQNPIGRFMQRKVRNAPLREVESLTLKAGSRQLEGLHKNRRSLREAYWVYSTSPDRPSKTLGNFVSKTEQLNVTEYLKDQSIFDNSEPVMELRWRDRSGKTIDTLELKRSGTGTSAKYLVKSEATRFVAQTRRSLGEQLEADLDIVFTP